MGLVGDDGLAHRVFQSCLIWGLLVHRAFRPILVSVPPCSQRVLRALVCGHLGLAGWPAVHEGSRGIELFGEYNKGS